MSEKPTARIGMTAQQVENSTNWGSPRHKNKTITHYGTNEQWVYDDYQYLYFENNRPITIQQ